jgi:hypothetical protein
MMLVFSRVPVIVRPPPQFEVVLPSFRWRPGARAGLEPATLVVNTGSGCSAAVKPPMR